MKKSKCMSVREIRKLKLMYIWSENSSLSPSTDVCQFLSRPYILQGCTYATWEIDLHYHYLVTLDSVKVITHEQKRNEMKDT